MKVIITDSLGNEYTETLGESVSFKTYIEEVIHGLPHGYVDFGTKDRPHLVHRNHIVSVRVT